jgi:ABC-2 type transport system permease protein
MFRSIFTKSLRDYRWAILGWGIGLGVIVYTQYATFKSTLGGTSAAQIQQLVNQFRFFGEAVKVGTPGGFVTFKIMGLLPTILGIWAVLAGARMIRGEEERGTLDIVLSTPQSRLAVLMQKVLALTVAMGVIAVIISLWIMAGMASANVTVDPAKALLASLNAGILALFFGLLALLLAQFMGRSAAAGWAGGLMAAGYVIDGTGRAVSSAAWLRPISPFYYYNRNLPLVPGYPVRWGALLLLVALCFLAALVTVPLFGRRDVGRTVLADITVRRDHRQAAGQVIAAESRDVWTRSIGPQAIRRQANATIWWIVSLSIFAGYMVIVARTSEKQLAKLIGSSSFIKQLYNGTNIGTNSGFLSVLVFGYLPLLICIFAGIMASRWATDLDTGQLELVLGTPQPRPRVVFQRYSAVLVAVLITTLCVWLAIVLFAWGVGFSLDIGRVAEASAGTVPLALITASLVFALSGRISHTAVVGIMAVFLGVSYLADLLRTLLRLPAWVVNLSIFHAYGTPILTGLDWGAFAVMLGIAAAVLVLGTWQFSVRDVQLGAAAA